MIVTLTATAYHTVSWEGENSVAFEIEEATDEVREIMKPFTTGNFFTIRRTGNARKVRVKYLCKYDLELFVGSTLEFTRDCLKSIVKRRTDSTRLNDVKNKTQNGTIHLYHLYEISSSGYTISRKDMNHFLKVIRQDWAKPKFMF